MTDYRRMQQRGATEAEILSSGDVPLEREIVVASDTGAFWIADGVHAAADLPKQGPVQQTSTAGMLALPTGDVVPTVNRQTGQLADVVRAAIANAVRDPNTPEGAAVAAVAQGGSTALEYDASSGLYTVPDGSSLTYETASGLYSMS